MEMCTVATVVSVGFIVACLVTITISEMRRVARFLSRSIGVATGSARCINVDHDEIIVRLPSEFWISGRSSLIWCKFTMIPIGGGLTEEKTLVGALSIACAEWTAIAVSGVDIVIIQRTCTSEWSERALNR